LQFAYITRRARAGGKSANQGQIACRGAISSHRTFDEFGSYGILVFGTLFRFVIPKKIE
jgi:hypothetical protein